MNKIKIEPTEMYEIHYLCLSGKQLENLIECYVETMYKIKNISDSLQRAIEEGDPMNTGIVVGQVMYQLKGIHEKRTIWKDKT